MTTSRASRTGLCSRTAWEQAKERHARVVTDSVAVVFLDVDQFKRKPPEQGRMNDAARARTGTAPLDGSLRRAGPTPTVPG